MHIQRGRRRLIKGICAVFVFFLVFSLWGLRLAHCDDKKNPLRVMPRSIDLEIAGDHKALPASPVRVEEEKGPLLKVSWQDSALGRLEEHTLKNIIVKITARGSGTLPWTVQCTEPWLHLNKEDFQEQSDHQALSVSTGGRDGAEETSPHNSEEVFLMPSARNGAFFTGQGDRTFTVTVDTHGLSPGEYKGYVYIRSQRGDENIPISFTVARLESIALSPQLITVPLGRKRLFSPVGIWSDGVRRDVSGSSEGVWRLSNPAVGSFLRHKPLFIATSPGVTEIVRIFRDIESEPAYVEVRMVNDEPLLRIMPQEINFGKIGPGETSSNQFILENVGSGSLNWITGTLEGWEQLDEPYLSGIIEDAPCPLEVSVRSLPNEEAAKKNGSTESLYPIEIAITQGDKTVVFRNHLREGAYRESIKLYGHSAQRTIFLSYEIVNEGSRASLDVAPHGFSLGRGEAGSRYFRKIRVRNSGKSLLRWTVARQKNRRSFYGIPLPEGRYVSFVNPAVRDNEPYRITEAMTASLNVRGGWYGNNGSPYSSEEGDVLKYIFNGTGIAIFFWRHRDGGSIKVYIDDRFVADIDCRGTSKERSEHLVAEGLEKGPHVLTLATVKEGAVVVEGARVHGAGCRNAGGNWITLSPDRGTTAGETDYVNVAVDLRGLKPGCYTEYLLFDSNGGRNVVEISVDVEAKTQSELIAIHRYSKGNDCLLLAGKEERDSDRMLGYKDEGFAFALFSQSLPGTAEFCAWYSPVLQGHYYSSDRTGDGKNLEGYTFEGSIGNIAVVPLPDTRELYRFYNPETKHYAYTTELKGGEYRTRGYRYDGIAGYVR